MNLLNENSLASLLTNCVDRFIRNRPPQIRFENGSVLTFISSSQVEQTRGQRYHEALSETIYKRITKKPTNHSREVEVDDTSKEILDDFLDSFKINNSLEFGA